MAISFGNVVNAAVATGLLNHRPRGPNLVLVPCETEENEQSSLRLTPGQVRQVALEYVQWRLQNDGIKMKVSTNARQSDFSTLPGKRWLLHMYHQVRRSEGLAETNAMVYLYRASAFSSR